MFNKVYFAANVLKGLISNWRLVLFILLLQSTLFTQTFTGKINGIILDSRSGESIPNAAIVILNTELFATSKADGTFRIEDVQQGNIQIRVTHIAYQENLINLNFIEEEKTLRILLVPKLIELSQVVVTDRYSVSKFDEINELSGVLRGKELQRELGFTLASTLKNETGLAIRSMGPAPARPVIRGLGGDRVLISEDGRKTIDLSATSPDHAVSIDPFFVERIEVIRGPKTLLKTPTTIGGVVNVVRSEIPDEVHEAIHGSAGFFGESANLGYLGAFTTDIPVEPFTARLELSRREAGDIKTPEGKLENSYARNFNRSAGLSYVGTAGHLGISYRKFDLDYEIPGGFVGAHPNGVDITLYREQVNAAGRYNLSSSVFDNIEMSLSNVIYRHKEFESSGRIGAEFKIINVMGYANLNHKEIGMFNSGTAGISFESRDFNIGGFVFTPRSKSLNVSAYIFESFSNDKFGFEFGARYNFDKITPEQEDPSASIGYIRERIYNTYSLSFSILYEFSDILVIGGNINKSSRVPTIEELYSEGPHLAAYSYEIGNPELNAESGIGTELFFFHQLNGIFFNLIFFNNYIFDYIIPRNTGEINYATFLPIYATSGVDAQLYGIELTSGLKLTERITLSLNSSYTRGLIRGVGESLPQIPPFKANTEIKYSTARFVTGIGVEGASRQNKVDLFEEPTAGYITLNTFFQYFLVTSEIVHNFSVNIDNMLNTIYRNHLSRVKSILPEAGRSFRLTYRMFF